MMSRSFEYGQVFERDHPFTLCVENKGDPEFEFKRWRPGAWDMDYIYPDDAQPLANGVGRVRFTVISMHTPPGHRPRVFFKRQFFKPDGSSYATSRLKNCTVQKFEADIESFPFHYEVDEL